MATRMPSVRRVFERIVGHTKGAARGVASDDDSLTTAPDSLPVVSAVNDTLLYDSTGTQVSSVDRFREICRNATAPVWLVPCLSFVVISPAN